MKLNIGKGGNHTVCDISFLSFRQHIPAAKITAYRAKDVHSFLITIMSVKLDTKFRGYSV